MPLAFFARHSPLRWSRPEVPARTKELSVPPSEVFRLLSNPAIPIAALCKYVDSDVGSLIDGAHLLESRVYIKRDAPIAPHRRIILRLRAQKDSHYWLLLERMPTSRRALIRGLGKTPQNDLGQVVDDDKLGTLIDLHQYKLENKQVFNSVVTLSYLRRVMQAMGEVMVNYDLLSVNCWSFCAILQYELGWESQSFFQFGAAVENRMWSLALQKVHDRVQQLHHRINPTSMYAIMHSRVIDTGDDSWLRNSFLVMTEQIDQVQGDDVEFPEPHQAMVPLISLIDWLSHDLVDHATSIELATCMMSTIRRLANIAPDLYLPLLAKFLMAFGVELSLCGMEQEARQTVMEALGIKRHICQMANDVPLDVQNAGSLTLREVSDDSQLQWLRQRYLDFYDIGVETSRQLYLTTPNPERLSNFVDNVERFTSDITFAPPSAGSTLYAEALSFAQQHPQDRHAHAHVLFVPYVSNKAAYFHQAIGDYGRGDHLMRELLAWERTFSVRLPTRDVHFLAKSLHDYVAHAAISLGRYDEEIKLFAEDAIRLRSDLYHMAPSKYCRDLYLTLRLYRSRLVSKHSKETLSIDDKIIAALRDLSRQDPTRYRELAKLLTARAYSLYKRGQSHEGYSDVMEARELLERARTCDPRHRGVAKVVQALLLNNMDRLAEAREVSASAITILKEALDVAKNDRIHERSGYTLTLYAYRKVLLDCAQIDEGDEVHHELLEVSPSLFNVSPTEVLDAYVAGEVSIHWF